MKLNYVSNYYRDYSSNSAAWSAAASLADTAATTIATASNSRKGRQWQEKMYGIQRQDALSDWTRQNEYNSPASQMARFKAAGLNPNLIYGQGTEGNSESVRASQSGNWSPQTPQFNIGSAFAAYQDARQRAVQTDNLKAQHDLLLQEKVTRAIAQNNMLLEGDTKYFDLSQKRQLAGFSLEAAKLSNDKLLNEINLGRQTLRFNDSAQPLDLRAKEQSIQAGFQAIQKGQLELDNYSIGIRQQLANLANTISDTQNKNATGKILAQQLKDLSESTKMKDLDNQLKEKGVQPSDGWLWRQVQDMQSKILKGQRSNVEDEFSRKVREGLERDKKIGKPWYKQ